MLFPDREMPRRVWDVEAENFAWIDFFWSTMGRSGEFGRGVETIHERMKAPEELKKLLANLADGLAKRFDLPGWGDWTESKLLMWVFNCIVDKHAGAERTRTEELLSEDAKSGLWTYANGPLREQVLLECDENMPLDATFVFGHTHKPFEEGLNFQGYPKWVNVYNSGGWVVESQEAQPLHGAAMILVDENLDATSVRMYNEMRGQETCLVRVDSATHPGEGPHAFHSRMATLVRAEEEPWRSFSALAGTTVSKRAKNLQARISGGTT